MAKKNAVSTSRQIDSVDKMYELMIILNPNLLDSAVKKKLKEITDLIESSGGKITNEDFWGKKKMAYRMRGHQEGNYTVYNLTMPSTMVKELREFLRIEKDVLRSLLTTVPADYVYTKYEIKEMPKEAPKKSRSSKPEKNVSVKHNAPVIEPKKKDEADEKEASSTPDANLDKKLDSILEGGDLNL